MSKRFLKNGDNYARIDEVESVRSIDEEGSIRAMVSLKSGAYFKLPAGVPAAYVVEMLIQGEVIDVAEEWKLSNTEGF